MKFYASFPINAQTCLINRAMAYGDGVFETLLVVNGTMPLWDLHYQRLSEGLCRLNIKAPQKILLTNKIQALITDNKRQVVKIMVFRDDDKRGYQSQSQRAHFSIVINPLHNHTLMTEMPVSSIKLARQNILAGMKHLNRLEQVMAAQALANTEYNDALMLDTKNNMIETISKNIILIKNNKLYTPNLNKCGVYGVALRWLQSCGYELKWKKIEFESLYQYDGFLVCNSIIGFQTITKINEIQFDEKHKIVKEIQKKWDAQFKLV